MIRNSVRKVGEYSLTCFQLESVSHEIFERTRIDLGVSRVAIKSNYKEPGASSSKCFLTTHKVLQKQVVGFTLSAGRPPVTSQTCEASRWATSVPQFPRFLVSSRSTRVLEKRSCEDLVDRLCPNESTLKPKQLR